ncbi:hypothetical protein ID866_7923 [Astraeus odoratus]|nr:hypothetical protein ID866_7923 [Astraeus odoratus]
MAKGSPPEVSMSASNAADGMSGSQPILHGQNPSATADPAVHEEIAHASGMSFQETGLGSPCDNTGSMPTSQRTNPISAQDMAKALTQAGNTLGIAETTKISATKNQSLATKYLQPITTFNSVSSSIAGLNTYAKLALGTLTTASQSLLSGKRLGKNIFSETKLKIASYNSTLDGLMQQFHNRAVVGMYSGIQLLQEDMNVDGIAYAKGVGLNKSKRCLDGTRTEIQKEIIDWMEDTRADSPWILLYGQAGKGKSAIAHTIAHHAKNLGKLGSCFCFARVRQNEGLQEKLFTTIARDLTDCDLRLRPLLAGVLAGNRSLRDTQDIMEQWERFILEPFSKLEGVVARNILVVIDALDESGGEMSRRHILKIMSSTRLPAGLRILLTSRPLEDIHRTISSMNSVKCKSLDDIPLEATIRDIRLYVSSELEQFKHHFTESDFDQLAQKAGGVFEWARLACEFIRPRPGVFPVKRCRQLLSQKSSDGGNLLDDMYTTILDDILGTSTETLDVFRSVMRQVICTLEPLPATSLTTMRFKFPHEEDHYDIGGVMLCYMGSLLAGATDSLTPIRPLHASFYDFLTDENRSHRFFIGDAGRSMLQYLWVGIILFAEF